jgi:hypothetical protein
MYRCDKCKNVSKPRESMHRVIVQTRDRVYNNADGIEVGRGKETVREIKLDTACFEAQLKETK